MFGILSWCVCIGIKWYAMWKKEGTLNTVKGMMDIFSRVCYKYMFLQGIKARSHNVFFSDCDCDSFHRNKWVTQDSIEVFTLCDCDNITNSYAAHCEQKINRSHKIAQCERALRAIIVAIHFDPLISRH